jgi:hypothetical protein
VSRDQSGQAADIRSGSGSGAYGPETPVPRATAGPELGERQLGERQLEEIQDVAAGLTGPRARRTTRRKQDLASRDQRARLPT